MMKRVEVHPGEILLVDAAIPVPGPAELRIETTVTGVCGSDTHAAHGRHPFVPLPYRPGHEVVGVVREVGAETTGFSLGDHASLKTSPFTGHRHSCVIKLIRALTAHMSYG